MPLGGDETRSFFRSVSLHFLHIVNCVVQQVPTIRDVNDSLSVQQLTVEEKDKG